MQGLNDQLPHVDDLRAQFPCCTHTIYHHAEYGTTMFNMSPAAWRLANPGSQVITVADMKQALLFDVHTEDVLMATGMHNCFLLFLYKCL
jgi:hypothetical protein